MKKSKFTKHTRKHTSKHRRKHASKHTKRNTRNKRRSVRKFGGSIDTGFNAEVRRQLKAYIKERVKNEPDSERKKQELLDNLDKLHFDPDYNRYLPPPLDGNTPFNQGISYIETYLLDGVNWWENPLTD